MSLSSPGCLYLRWRNNSLFPGLISPVAFLSCRKQKDHPAAISGTVKTRVGQPMRLLSLFLEPPDCLRLGARTGVSAVQEIDVVDDKMDSLLALASTKRDAPPFFNPLNHESFVFFSKPPVWLNKAPHSGINVKGNPYPRLVNECQHALLACEYYLLRSVRHFLAWKGRILYIYSNCGVIKVKWEGDV